MSNIRFRALLLTISLSWLLGVVAACGSEEEEEEGSGFDRCITANEGYFSCDAYCASISRACLICDCPEEYKDSIACVGGRQHSAFGWKTNAQCDGAYTVTFDGCSQGVFQDSSGAVIAMSVRCCCE